ncbi:methoxymalonate biosynthesis acyl carrier protein [Janthinobacterium sp. CG_23.3]
MNGIYMEDGTHMNEIKETLRTFIGGFVRSKQFKDSDNIFEAGFVNSMFVMQLILFIEKEYALAVDNADLELKNFSSVDAMGAFVSSKLGTPHAQAS